MYLEMGPLPYIEILKYMYLLTCNKIMSYKNFVSVISILLGNKVKLEEKIRNKRNIQNMIQINSMKVLK